MLSVVLDVWSIGHLLAGLYFALYKLRFWHVLAATGLWEAFELIFGPLLDLGDPSALNSLGDLLCNLAGWLIARQAIQESIK